MGKQELLKTRIRGDREYEKKQNGGSHDCGSRDDGYDRLQKPDSAAPASCAVVSVSLAAASVTVSFVVSVAAVWFLQPVIPIITAAAIMAAAILFFLIFISSSYSCLAVILVYQPLVYSLKQSMQTFFPS